jgi:fructan beta-fructosidase
LKDNDGAYEIEMTIKNSGASKIMFALLNEKDEKVNMYYDIMRKQFVMDRSESGKVDFSVDFPAVTVAPVFETDDITLRLFVDRSSIEAFGENGKFVMTNQVFPSEPYNRMSFVSDRGNFTVKSMTVYRIN